MAVLDPDGDAVVIRIAYDGAPMAGKTTSVVSLGKSLGAGVKSPAEVGGRTLYFDWLDYTGGLFEGRKIRCQVISVPGQASLAPRRRRLLEEADAIVFVGDSTPAGFHADRSYLSGLTRVLEGLPGPPVGIVLQANKRDHADAVPMERIRELLDGFGMRIGIVESVATEGAGIREAFVFAVRLALDRVRELMRSGQLQKCRPSVNSADELLDELKRAEGGALDFAASSGVLTHTRLADVEQRQQPVSEMSRVVAQVIGENAVPAVCPAGLVDETRDPAVPDAHVGSGFVWPPVDGRIILHELSGAKVRLMRNPRGDWLGIANERWRMISPADAVFADVEAGRAVLVNAARSHAARSQGRVVDRCVVLACDGAGRHRLWNISPVESAVQNAAVGSDVAAD